MQSRFNNRYISSSALIYFSALYRSWKYSNQQKFNQCPNCCELTCRSVGETIHQQAVPYHTAQQTSKSCPNRQQPRRTLLEAAVQLWVTVAWWWCCRVGILLHLQAQRRHLPQQHTLPNSSNPFTLENPTLQWLPLLMYFQTDRWLYKTM